VPFSACSVGGMFGFFFHPGPVRSYADSQQSHDGRFRKFFGSMLEQGIYLAPSRFEAGFVSLAHRPGDIAQTLEAARVAMQRAARVR
jgi:glutamate-1-semialdehyde 2,1-aminomutase